MSFRTRLCQVHLPLTELTIDPDSVSDRVEKAAKRWDVLLSRHRAWATGHVWASGRHSQDTQTSIQMPGWVFHAARHSESHMFQKQKDASPPPRSPYIGILRNSPGLVT